MLMNVRSPKSEAMSKLYYRRQTTFFMSMSISSLEPNDSLIRMVWLLPMGIGIVIVKEQYLEYSLLLLMGTSFVGRKRDTSQRYPFYVFWKNGKRELCAVKTVNSENGQLNSFLFTSSIRKKFSFRSETIGDWGVVACLTTELRILFDFQSLGR